jgi:hypothetical protein
MYLKRDTVKIFMKIFFWSLNEKRLFTNVKQTSVFLTLFFSRWKSVLKNKKPSYNVKKLGKKSK